MIFRVALCVTFLMLGCARADTQKPAPPAFPLSAYFSPDGSYVVTSWLSQGRAWIDVYDTETGRKVKQFKELPIWGSYSNNVWYYEGGNLRAISLGGKPKFKLSDSLMRETRSLRADPAVSSLHLAADMAVYLRKESTETGRDMYEIVACRFGEAKCDRAKPVVCAQFRNSTLTPRRAGTPTIGLRCKNQSLGKVQIDDYFWPVGGELTTISSPDTDYEQQIGAVDGAPALIVRDVASSRLALRPLVGGVQTVLTLDGPLSRSDLVRSSYEASSGQPLVASYGGRAWRILGTSGGNRLLLEPQTVGDHGELCIVLERQGVRQYLSCRPSYGAETITARDASGRALTAHYYTPAGTPAGLVIRFHGGPFLPLPAAPESDVMAWLAANVSVLDVGFVGGEGFADAIMPSADSSLPAMVEEARALQEALRKSHPSLATPTYVSGVSFGGMPALAFARMYPDLRGVYLVAPLCSPSAQRADWSASPWMPTYRAPFGLLMDRGSGELRDVSCASLMMSGPPVFVAYSKNDPVLGKGGVQDLEGALLVAERRTQSAVSDVSSHPAFTVTEVFNQVLGAKAWFDQAQSDGRQ